MGWFAWEFFEGIFNYEALKRDGSSFSEVVLRIASYCKLINKGYYQKPKWNIIFDELMICIFWKYLWYEVFKINLIMTISAIITILKKILNPLAFSCSQHFSSQFSSLFHSQSGKIFFLTIYHIKINTSIQGVDPKRLAWSRKWRTNL